MPTTTFSSARIAAATAALCACVAALPAAAQNPAVTLDVDAGANRQPISPLIYGIAYGNPTTLADLNAPLNRYGGNNGSRYNWRQNADNRANDWYFQSIPEPSATQGERGDTFIEQSRQANAEPMVTIPMLDWIAKLGPNRTKLASYSIAKYGAQTGSDWQWFPDAGNGILASTGQPITWIDPNDANTANTTAIQQGWGNHLVARWGRPHRRVSNTTCSTTSRASGTRRIAMSIPPARRWTRCGRG